MSRPSVLFHVGYHKTGTTWMQRRLFVPAAGYQPLFDHQDVFDHITRPHRLAFRPEAVREVLEARLAEAPADLAPVVSSEILSGHPFWGGRDSADFAERIQATWPEAKILLTIRAQIPAIASVYMQYVRRGGCLSARRFFAGSHALGFDGFDPVHFEYDRLVRHYQTIFGSENVRVQTQEQLAKDPAGFVAGLAAFAGAPEAPMPSTKREAASESEHAVPFLRRINRFFKDGANPAPLVNLTPAAHFAYRLVGWGFRRPAVKKLLTSRPVTAVAREMFEGRFGAANAALLELQPDLDLSRYELP